MDESKRSFLKIAGASAVGLGLGAPVVKQAMETEPPPRALSGTGWVMVVDTKKCRENGNCTACIDACHHVHNVPEIDNHEEEVKWIWKESYEHAFPVQYHSHTEEGLRESSVLVFCNHCEAPPCVRVCPTQATWKREDGIVMMDQHRCIGCRYCVVACPYGSRSFNWQDPRPHIQEIRNDYPTRTKGVVEKCNFCAERLARGLLPACVEACSQVAGVGAMAFGDPQDPSSEVSRLLRERYSIRRKPNLGTGPQVYYLV
jgi:molybdopterin-containing oxidoreductase family iron-sulfur binding subunit